MHMLHMRIGIIIVVQSCFIPLRLLSCISGDIIYVPVSNVNARICKFGRKCSFFTPSAAGAVCVHGTALQLLPHKFPNQVMLFL